MPGLVPGIHVFTAAKTWMAGTSPATTNICVNEARKRSNLPAENCRAAEVEGSAWCLTMGISFKTVRHKKAPDDAGAFKWRVGRNDQYFATTALLKR
jgi:hypothetical protein